MRISATIVAAGQAKGDKVSSQMNRFENWVVQNIWYLVFVALLVLGVVVGSVAYSNAHPQPPGTHYVYVPQYDSNI